MSVTPGNKVILPKRKRPEGEEGGSGGMSTPLAEGRPKRRRNDTTLVDTIQYIFDALRNKKKDEDLYLCEPFLRVPRKKTEPQYYDMIKSPIDMLKIQQKIKTDVYNELEEFCKDVQLLVDNAKLYYAKSTEEYKDACELWEIFLAAKERAPEEINKEKLRQQQMEEEERQGKRGMFARYHTPFHSRSRGMPKTALAMSAPMILEEDTEPMTMEDAVEELFGAVITAMDNEGRIYSYDFRLLPSKNKYPEYYQLIEHPIDLKMVAQRIQAKQYKTVDDLEDDFALLFNNACSFNEPGSRIFKDARTLKKLVQLRKNDLLQILNAKKTVRLRSKRSTSNKPWSVLVAELEDGVELPLPEEDGVGGGTEMPLGTPHEDEESDEDVDPDNPQWQLFLAAKNLTAPSDPNYQLVEPFKRLPNRRWHADYYVEIKNPISMSQIRKKIVKGDYRYIPDMMEDFNLMFDNAQQYNRPDSRIYRDAVKLQKYIQNKAEEIMAIEDEDSDSDSDDDDSHSQSVSRGQRRLARPQRPLTFKRRAKILFKTLMDYMTEDGRQPIVAFIEKPNRRDYPDYYEVITQPIDMETIESKIKGERYNTEEELISDFKLMFHNCQRYNEEGSVIHTDATTLERVLNEKIRELNQGDNSLIKAKLLKKPTRFPVYACSAKHVKSLYSAVRDFRDSEGRQLSEVFMKLPSKALYPDYYEVIKQPIDLEKVLQKWRNNAYPSLDDIMADLTLMFQNACRYNEPDSQIYRDALTLQRHALEKRLELCSLDEGIPNVAALVQELFMSLFISVYNHEEEDGRYTAESFCELPDYDEVDGKKMRALSYDIMKRRLDKGLYTRLDHFQEDIFSVFERARRCSKLDSRTYLDAITLQTEYMKIRDELCNHGQILKSKALEFTEVGLNAQLESGRSHRQQESEQEAEDEDSKPPPQPTDGTNNSSLSHNEVQYFVGDFVYLSPPDKNCEYPILHIERLWTNSEGRQMVYGCNYYRPAETFHQPNRKFFEQEVFKTDQHHAYPLTEVIGKCYVLPLVDYVKTTPENVDEKDVFVCESRYNSRNRFFKKIKSFPFNVGERVKLVERLEPLEMKRVDSIFKERIERHKEELAELEEETKVIRRPLPNVAKAQGDGTSGNTYYEQYNIASGPVKVGDYVYVKGREAGKKSIRQICQLWVTPEGTAHFHGTMFKYASQTNPSGDQLSYRQEVYLTAGMETLPVSDITGRCMVMDMKDYCSFRLTEICESDVYVCESFLDEMNQRVSPLQSGLRKYKLSNLVNPDEVYYFKKPININKSDPSVTAVKKQPLPYEAVRSVVLQESSPLTPRMDLDYDDSMDGPPPSVASVDSGVITGTPKVIKKTPTGKQFQQVTGKKQVTGYILFAAEIRKSITLKNPTANFGEVSRLVGIEWKRLTETDRKIYEDRAHQMNLENAERALSGNGPDSPQASQASQLPSSADLPLPNNPDVVFECMWESCDHMFEDLADLSDHLLLEATGHVFKVTQVFECGWRGCSRHKKSSLAPFPVVQRLAKHVREIHILKNTGRIIQHHDRSRNFMASTRQSLLSLQSTATTSSSTYTSTSGLIHGIPGRGITLPSGVVVNYPGISSTGQLTHHAQTATGGVNGSSVTTRSYEPMFVAPPPKTQRLLHSEAYIKYIENLDKPFISNWEKHLMATQENTGSINDSGRLPVQWLASGAGSHGTVVNALWALREYMMKDSLGIAKIL
ncbi:protein polybromo-1-like isoform X6 [Eriocheir sinensis]|uniref:protein polybromo-1-like isoform X6 n=1 Tax=Eriocheir sinensis TaxID=95602 RepID=UPI0021C6901A|nr:protein polybromo-1-like isoform X6 [Eriocheir sinensis]